LETNQPKISIITVCLNAVNTIDATIKSVLKQTFKNIEYLVVDGASTDGTIALLEKYSNEGKLNFISERDNGIYDAMNKGLRMANGDWIFFIGSDDTLFNDEVIERIFSSDYSNAEIIYGNVQLLHSGKIYDGPFDHEKLSQRNICHQGMFVKNSVYKKLGGFNNEYPVAADYVFNLQWMGMGAPAVYIEEIISIYNEQGLSFHVRDQKFHDDRDKLLVENNIVCRRSFEYLKQSHYRLSTWKRYKLADKVFNPLARIKTMISQWR
jgi:glycosyltransferase involved in cell wall biosynthesis